MISSVVIIVLIIVFIVLGFFRGAARTLLNLAAMAASAVISHFLGSYLAQAAYDTFLKNNIIAHLQSNAGEYGVDYTAHNSISALPSGVQNLLNGFTRLLMVQEFPARKPEYYANELNITKGHLADVVKEKSGKTTMEWINERTTLLAQAMLASSNEMLESIAERLRFSDASQFIKFFKKQTEHDGQDNQ